MEKILVLGSEGFCGSCFRDFLKHKVKTGAVIYVDRIPTSRAGGGNYRQVNLLDRDRILALLKELRPDLIFNFAGLLFSNDLAKLVAANVLTAENLLVSIQEIEGYSPRVLFIGSAAEYGVPDASELPIKESSHKRPVTNYGLSKVFLDSLIEKHLLHSRTLIYRVKPFNIIGPGQSEKLVFGALVAQLKMIKREEHPPELYVGNLDAERDFIDIRDVFSAYWKIIWSDSSGEVFHVASGKPTKIKTLVEMLIKLSGIEIRVVQKKELMKANDASSIYADITKIQQKLGWKPEFSLKLSIQDVLSSELASC